tara:strand:+ start:1247 stop:1897 length:651 start_codon:yes stop_codon:yes gene_type:complete
MKNKNKSRLIAYFCSFGFSGSMFDDDWKNNAAPRIVADHYNLEFINRSVPGTSTHKQYEAINNDLDNGLINTDNDIVFVQWSFPARGYASNFTGSYTPHDTSNNKNVKWYYENMYTERFANSQVLSYASTLHSLLHGNIYQGLIRGLKMSMSCPRGLYNSVINNINCIAFNHGNMVNELKENVHPTDALHKCDHPTDIGHEYIANKYIEKIEEIIK